MQAKLERYDLIGTLDPSHFFPTTESAIDAFTAGAEPGMGVRPTQSQVRTPL